MRHVASNEGRTVLFVSHNTGALSNLCTRGIVLDAGAVVADTDVNSALASYLKSTSSRDLTPQPGLATPRIESVTLDEPALLAGGFELHIRFVSPFELRPPIGGVTITDTSGRPLIGTNARMHPDGFVRTPARDGVLICRIPRLPLHSGHYGVSVWLGDMHQDYDAQHDVLSFHFASPDFRTDAPPVSSIGPYNVRADWRWQEQPSSIPVCP
jgi:lipopolysaccharide transport system ATP-binding protein